MNLFSRKKKMGNKALISND